MESLLITADELPATTSTSARGAGGGGAERDGARGGGVAPFQERCRIDEARAGLRETLGLEPPAELAQVLADDVVVVAARGVARDPSAAR